MSGKVANSIAALSFILIGAGLLIVSLIAGLVLLLAALGFVFNANMITTILLSLQLIAIPIVIGVAITGFVSVRVGFGHFFSGREQEEDAATPFAQPNLGDHERPIFMPRWCKHFV